MFSSTENSPKANPAATSATANLKKQQKFSEARNKTKNCQNKIL
jgi:hypothetical protein